jgi:hypothetical protein
LHRAIRNHATLAALQIIELEYNTYLAHYHSWGSDFNHEKWTTTSRIVWHIRCHPSPHLLSGSLLQASNVKNVTPLVLAIQTGSFDVVQALLQRHVSWPKAPEVRDTLLVQAAHHGRTKIIACIVDYYLSHRSNNDISGSKESFISWPETLRDLVDVSNGHKTTPLMRAAGGPFIHGATAVASWCIRTSSESGPIDSSHGSFSTRTRLCM